MSLIKESRAGKAGRRKADSIIESLHLMYQRQTALNYLRPLVRGLEKELKRREDERQKNC